jgi:ATP-dependent Clp protease ATP-binding subunit ClpX
VNPRSPRRAGPTSAGIPETLRPSSNTAAPKPAVRAAATPPTPAFSFRLRPREVARHLGRFVIGQLEAKKVLSVALCDHFQHVRMCLEGRDAPFYQKQNVLLLGPTGVGKTHLIRSAADLIGVPFIKADATKFSETGYVGGDVDDLVRDLVRRAGGDVRRAEHGIIYLDEIDKLAGRGEGRDVSGRGVQTNLLKLMEDGDVPLVAPNDVGGQIEAAMAASRGSPRGGPESASTRNILFVASGAFSGIGTIVRHRLEEESRKQSANPLPTTADLIRFGLEPEFVGRLPVRVACHPLDADDLFNILRKSESSLTHQYERAFAAYGIRLTFRDDALRRIAELAHTEQTGARGLMTVMERAFRDLKFALPSTRVRAVTATAAVIDNPRAELKRLTTPRNPRPRG